MVVTALWSYSSWAAVTQYQRLADLNNRNLRNSLVAQWLGLCAFTARVRVRSLVGEQRSRKPLNAAPTTQEKRIKKENLFSHRSAPHCVLTWWREGGLVSLSLLIRAVISAWGSTLMTSSIPPKNPTFKYHHIGELGLPHMNIGGTQTFSS